MTKQPDRFERMVRKYTRSDEDVGYLVFLFPQDVINLLRKEHQAVVRMVEKEKVSGDTGTEGDRAYNQALDDILVRLKKRAT